MEGQTVKEALDALELAYDPDRDWGLGAGVGRVAPGGDRDRRVADGGAAAPAHGDDRAGRRGEGKGSARSIPGFNLYEAIRDCSDHLVRFGGHRMAAGCAIRADRVDGFREAFNARARQVLREEDLVPEVRIDLEMDLRHADQDLVRMLRHAGPFGAGNATPVFAARGVAVEEHRIVGQGHLKMMLGAYGTRLEAIGFGMGERCQEPGFGAAAGGRGVQAGGKPLQRPHHRPGPPRRFPPRGVAASRCP